MLTAHDQSDSHIKHGVNYLSLFFDSLTWNARRSFGLFQHIALVACLSLQITPLYSKSTLRKTILLHTLSRTLIETSLSLAQTMMERRQQSSERHYSGELVSFSALRFSINNCFSSAVSQIKASRLLSYPTQLWGEEAIVARQNS